VCLAALRPTFALGDVIRYHPDRDCVANQALSVCHRAGARIDRPNNAVLASFATYARWIIRGWGRADPCKDASFDVWCRASKRSAAEVLKFERAVNGKSHFTQRDFRCKSFLKDEAYDGAKYPRGINGFEDCITGVLGPIFAIVDAVLFKNKHFVKSIPVAERPGRLEHECGGEGVVGTDFSSFECHHRGLFARLGVFWILHIIQGCGFEDTVKQLVVRMLLGVNHCRFNACEAVVDETLMSGAVWTSSLNGALNLCLFSFMVLASKYPGLGGRALAKKFGEFRGLIEGDDGIAVCSKIDAHIVDSLGIKLKAKYFKDYTQASFCGIVCAERGTNRIICDPIKVLCDFPCIASRYGRSSECSRSALLRAKAFSYKFQYPHCPIIGTYVDAILRRTAGIDIRRICYKLASVEEGSPGHKSTNGSCPGGRLPQKKGGGQGAGPGERVVFTTKQGGIFYVAKEYGDEYKRRLLAEAMSSFDGKWHKIASAPKPQDRVLMEEVFGVAVEYQIAVEHELRKFALGKPHELPEHQRMDNFRGLFSKSHKVIIRPELSIDHDAFKRYAETHPNVGVDYHFAASLVRPSDDGPHPTYGIGPADPRAYLVTDAWFVPATQRYVRALPAKSLRDKARYSRGGDMFVDSIFSPPLPFIR